MFNFDTQTDEMEMPCKCDCGKWFDLHDGYSLPNSNQVICKDCYNEAKAELDRQEQIVDLLAEYNDAIWTIRNTKEQLKALKYDTAQLDIP
jgi:hypothetical protein